MSTLHKKSKFFDKLNFWLKMHFDKAYVLKLFVSLSVFIYLSCIVMGGIDKSKKRLELPELGLAAVLLLINSEIAERLQQIKLGKDSVDLMLKGKLHSNLKTNQKESQALTYLGEILLSEEKYKDYQKTFFDILLNDGDLDFLESFYISERKFYDKSDKKFDHVLHLVSLGFIKTQSDYDQIESLIDKIPNRGDLKEYYRLSDEGKKCLELGSSTIIPLGTNYCLVDREKNQEAKLAKWL